MMYRAIRYVVGSMAGAIDALGVLAFSKRKNMDLGWGSDLYAVLDHADKYLISPKGSLPVEWDKVTWDGPWKEIPSVSKDKLTFLGRVKVLCFGDDVNRTKYKTLLIRDGSFPSPYASLLPEGSKTAYFRFVLPKKDDMSVHSDPSIGVGGVLWDGDVAIQFPATGDEGFSARSTWYAEPLAARDGIASVIMIMAYYGKRRPTEWGRRKGVGTFETFSQVVKMSNSVILEGVSLLRWLKSPSSQKGLGLKGNVCLTGISLGGSMASCAAGLCNEAVAVAPCLVAHCASAAWVDGVLSQTVDWQALCKLPSAQSPAQSALTVTTLLPSSLDKRIPSHVVRQPQTKAQAKELAQHILEQVAHVNTAPPPVCPRAVVCVAAEHDKVVQPKSSVYLANAWGKDVELRWIPGGHATSFMMAHLPFRRAIVDSLDRLKKAREGSSAPTSEIAK